MSVHMLLNISALAVKFITSGYTGDLWSNNIFLILACDDTIIQKRGVNLFTLWSLFPRSLQRTVLDQPTVDNEGVSRGRSVAVGTSTAIQHYELRHYESTFIMSKVEIIMLTT